jgi:hypothetical protein
MAVGFERAGAKTRRIRFTSDMSHEGVNYGPQFETDEAEIEARAAGNYVRSGRAQFVADGPAPERETFQDAPAQPGRTKGK